MKCIRKIISALAIVAVTATGGVIAVSGADDHVVVADRWCC